MVIAINYADEKFRNAQKLNTRTAKKWGADKVIEYSFKDIDSRFVERNKNIFNYERGAGYWLWKPYIILKTLEIMEDGDFLIYSDAGSAFVNKISYLINTCNRDKRDVMCFCIDQQERKWDKRDAIVLMNADNEEILNSNQICATYILVKKTVNSVNLIKEYLNYAQDVRIITDEPNVMGYENYPEFKENRHDQTIWSLLCKTRGILPYRDPSEYGMSDEFFSRDVLMRSTYPQIIESHRRKDIKYIFELKYATRWYHSILRFFYPKTSPLRRYSLKLCILGVLGKIKRVITNFREK